MSIDRVRDILERRGFKVKLEDGKVEAKYPNTPFKLTIVFEKNRMNITLNIEGDIRDYLEDVKELEENPREFIEEILDDINGAVTAIEQLARQEGVTITSNVRQVVLDVLDALEEILES